MAPLLIVAAVVGAAGTAISSIAQANALRSQASARQVEGEQELLSQKRRLRQELGLSAVEAGASGFLGGSFANVFESQAILDAEFLGQIKQRTDFDVANLKQQSRTTLITGLIGAGAQAAGGIAKFKGVKAQEEFLNRQTQRAFVERERQRRTQSSGSVFSTGSSGAGLLNKKLKLSGSSFN